jgi:recombinational DNA repair protein (RecF pathway)
MIRCERCGEKLKPSQVGKLFGHVVCPECLADAVPKQGMMRTWIETEIVLAEALRAAWWRSGDPTR